MRVIAVYAMLAVSLVPLWSCGQSNQTSVAHQGTSAASTSVSTACPATVPNASTPPGELPSPNHYGNGLIWVELWPGGIIQAKASDIQPDGSIAVKMPWWRGVPGQLSVEGYRLDTTAPPLWANIPPGYGESGFQATGLYFPSDGCWEVTGKVGNASLTFVTRIRR